VQFEWDKAKNRSNLVKHGLDFDDAERVLSGPCVTFEDDRFDYGDERLVTLGVLAGRVVVIAHSPRDDKTRIISMRRRIDVSKKSIKSDLERIDRMKDSEIDYSDIPALDKTFLKKAAVAWPPEKKQLTIRLDADVLTWLKGHGPGYQTRINRILRVVMESQPQPSRRTAR
jgi:uncharacterized DUF497 family protein